MELFTSFRSLCTAIFKIVMAPQEYLYGELAIPLEMEKNEVEAFISARVEILELA